MATKVYRLNNVPVKWARVFEHNRDLEGYEGTARDYEGQYSIEALLTDEQLQALEDTGSLLPEFAKETEDKDHPWSVRFKRKHKDRFPSTSGAPRVFRDKEESNDPITELSSWKEIPKDKWDSDEDGLIGNDSVCNIYFEVYETKRKRRGKPICGTRLVGVGVVDHQKFENNSDAEEEEVPF